MTNLSLVKTDYFEENKIDFYRKKGEYYLTRNQIGKALGYTDPRVAITKLHDRHKERLDKFSTVTKLVLLEGKRQVRREVVTYSFRGLCEICRYSEQPKADAFMDWVWDIIESLKNETKQSAEKILEGNIQPSNLIFMESALNELKQQKEKLDYIDNLSKQHTDSIMELAFNADGQKTELNNFKHNMGEIFKLVEKRLTTNEDVAKTLLNQVEKLVLFRNSISKDLTVNTPQTINVADEILNTAIQFYKRLRELATTENGYIGDKYVVKFKRLLGRFKNKRLVLASGFEENIIFENFQYEYNEAVGCDGAKSFANFVLKCSDTGNYKRIFVCDILEVKGRWLYLVDRTIKYEFI